MEFERQYDEFGGERGVPQGKEECLMRCARWARGVLMVMDSVSKQPGQTGFA